MRSRKLFIIFLLTMVEPMAWAQSAAEILEKSRDFYKNSQSLQLKVHYHFESEEGTEDMYGTFAQQGNNFVHEIDGKKVTIRHQGLLLTVNKVQQEMLLERDSSSFENMLLSVPVEELLMLFNRPPEVIDGGQSFIIKLERKEYEDVLVRVKLKVNKQSGIYESFTIETYQDDSLYNTVTISFSDIKINPALPEKTFDQSRYLSFSGNTYSPAKNYSSYHFTSTF